MHSHRGAHALGAWTEALRGTSALRPAIAVAGPWRCARTATVASSAASWPALPLTAAGPAPTRTDRAPCSRAHQAPAPSSRHGRARHAGTSRRRSAWRAASAAASDGNTTTSSSTTSRSATDYYRLLGVDETASQEEIKAAFKKGAKRLHPDVSQSVDAEQEFIALRRAYSTLSTPELRAEYDAKLGLASARAADPRFARFERWRREVVPDLRIQLELWYRHVDVALSDWRKDRDQREQQLRRLYDSCQQSLRRLQALQALQAQLQQPQQQQQQQQHHHHHQDHHHTSPASSSAPSPSSSSSAPPSVAPAAAAAATAAPNPNSASTSYASAASVSYDATDAANESLAQCAEALKLMQLELAGLVVEAEDGSARVQREVDKRYEQVAVRYPAYPDIVWLDVWEETAEQWLAEGRTEAQLSSAATSRWSAALRGLRAEVAAAAAEAEAQQARRAAGHVAAGVSAGRFSAAAEAPEGL